MSKKIKMVLVLAAMLSLAGAVQAGDWVSVSSKTGDWFTVAWDSGHAPPGNTDTALIIDSTITLPSPGITGSLDNLYVGFVLSSTLTVNAGANLSVTFTESVAKQGGVTGVLNLYGTNYGGWLRVGNEEANSMGTVNVYSGGLLTTGNVLTGCDIGFASGTGYGKVNLKGTGSMNVGGGSGLNIYATGHLDMEAGKLRVAGNQITQLADYIASGKITGYGGAGTVNAPVLGTGPDAGYTVVTANGLPPTCASQGVYLPADLNHDCYVNFADLMLFVEDWLKCNDSLDPMCQGDNFSAFAEGYPFSFIYGGVDSNNLLPQWIKQVQKNVLDANSTRTITTWVDQSSGLKVTFEKITYSDFPAVDWLLYFENTGDANTAIIENVQVLDTSISDPCYILHKTTGNHPDVNQFEVSTLPISTTTPQILNADNGVSSYKDLPFFKIETGHSSIIIAIGWTGNWQATMECPDDMALQLKAGLGAWAHLSKPHFCLYPGEKVRTPRILAMVWDGQTIESNAQFRQLIYKHYSPLMNGQKPLPVATCNTCFTRNGAWLCQTTEENQISLINGYAPLGVKIMVTDAGWYQDCNGDDWAAGMGSWVPRTDHYPNGMAPVAAAAADNNQIWGLWFAPEMVMPGTIIDTEHPELKIGSILNFGNPAARDYMYNIVDNFMQMRGFRVYRTDSGCVPTIEPEGANRAGITEIKHVMGLYEYWDRIIANRPDTFRIFAAHRIDIEVLKRFHVHQKSDIWCNNEIDQASMWALSQYLPNNQIETAIDRMDDYTFHSMLACSMTLGWIADANDFDFNRAQAILTKYRSIAPLLIGAWYPLLPFSRDTAAWMASQYHRPDLEQGIVLAFRHDNSTQSTKVLQLYGLTPAANYQVYFNSTGQTISRTGTQLMQELSITIPNQHQSELIEYKKY
jgi:alpha-galactosidase